MYNERMTDELLTSKSRHNLAMLIDGDNAQATLLPKMIVEAAKHGQVSVRRIYGDWTTSNMKSWKETLNFHAFQPIQQFRYTVGKNATDSAMIIDAMDLRAFGVGPRTWLEELHYRKRDRILIGFGLVILVASIGLSLFSFGKFWVPEFFLRLVGA